MDSLDQPDETDLHNTVQDEVEDLLDEYHHHHQQQQQEDRTHDGNVVDNDDDEDVASLNVTSAAQSLATNNSNSDNSDDDDDDEIENNGDESGNEYNNDTFDGVGDADLIGNNITSQQRRQQQQRRHHQIPNWMSLSWLTDNKSCGGSRTAIVRVEAEKDDEAKPSTPKTMKFCIVGTSKIQIRQGRVDILGTSLDATRSQESHTDNSNGVTICSPYWSSWITIEIDSTCLPCELALSSVQRHPDRFATRNNNQDGPAKEEQQQQNKRRKTDDNEIAADEQQQRGPPVSRASSTNRSAFRIMFPTRPIVLPPSWRDSVSQVIEDFYTSIKPDLSAHDRQLPRHEHRRNICLVTGAKGVGKSTLLRYMTNRMLSSQNNNDIRCNNSDDPFGDDENFVEGASSGWDGVAILDIDVGQPELAPPGMLSLSIVRKPLLRPPYWNLTTSHEVEDMNDESLMEEKDDQQRRPYRNSTFETVSSVFFGSTTSKTDPSRYLEGIAHLMGRYESIFCNHSFTGASRPPPLLINCDGWVKGLGYEILVALIQEVVKPTHICQIVGTSRAQSFDLSSIVADPITVRRGDSADGPQQIYEAKDGDNRQHPVLHVLEACTSMADASLCTIPSYTMRNFRWATYFLPSLTRVFDTWETMQAKDLQTGWIVAKQSAFESSRIEDGKEQSSYYGPSTSDSNSNNDLDSGKDNGDEYDVGDECILAQSLARERPYMVPFEAVDCQLIGSEFYGQRNPHDLQVKHRIIQAMNGNVVGLCTDAMSLESIGLGVVRSVDWNKQFLYIIVPDSVSSRFSLSEVKVLVGGHLPLPMALIFRGVHAESFVFHAVVKKTHTKHQATILGFEPMKSRNNLGRKSFMGGKP